MVLLPLLYCGGIFLYRPCFQEDKNRKRIPLRSVPEWLTLVAAETAFVRVWSALGRPGPSDMVFEMLFVMLSATTVLCMMDFWERVVPNKILLLLLLVYVVIAGMQALRDFDGLVRLLPSIVLGFLFSAMTFGLGCLLCRGKIGAGDIKLSLVMGLYLTGEYVVGAVFYGCLISAAFSLVQLLRKKLTRSDSIPFVPFLYMGLIVRYWIG